MDEDGMGADEMEPDATEAGAEPPEATVTLEYLKEWELHGATWRPVHVTDQRAVIQLCSCFGEPVDRVQGNQPELIAYVRAHPDR